MASSSANTDRKGSLLSRHMPAAVIAALAAASVLGTAHVGHAATAAATSTGYAIKATLNTKQEVPAPKDAVHASGVFTGQLTLAGKKSSFTWRLKVSHLSGRVREADVAMGVRGKR